MKMDDWLYIIRG